MRARKRLAIVALLLVVLLAYVIPLLLIGRANANAIQIGSINGGSVRMHMSISIHGQSMAVTIKPRYESFRYPDGEVTWTGEILEERRKRRKERGFCDLAIPTGVPHYPYLILRDGKFIWARSHKSWIEVPWLRDWDR